jgi:hypothetical protein
MQNPNSECWIVKGKSRRSKAGRLAFRVSKASRLTFRPGKMQRDSCYPRGKAGRLTCAPHKSYYIASHDVRIRACRPDNAKPMQYFVKAATGNATAMGNIAYICNNVLRRQSIIRGLK